MSDGHLVADGEEEEGGRRWLRQCRLVVALRQEDGSEQEIDALDFSDFRIRFTVKQATANVPCTAVIQVYNVSPETAARIEVDYAGAKRPVIHLEAGYQGDSREIFWGEVWNKTLGRESPEDTFMLLSCCTADRAHRFAMVNTAIPKESWTPDEIRALFGLADYGVPGAQYPADYPKDKSIRGRSVFMLASDYLSDIADRRGWAYGYGRDGTLIFQDKKEASGDPAEAIVLNAETGLIGRPSIDYGGLKVRCLLDPRVEIGKVIKIDNASIQRGAITMDAQNFAQDVAMTDESLDPDGLYVVLSREHEGDTMGDEWETRLVCRGLDSKNPVAVEQTNFNSNSAVYK